MTDDLKPGTTRDELNNQAWTMAAHGWILNLPHPVQRALMVRYTFDITGLELTGKPGDYLGWLERHWWLEHTWNLKFEKDLNDMGHQEEFGTPKDAGMFDCSIIEDLAPLQERGLDVEQLLKAAEFCTALCIPSWKVRDRDWKRE